MVNKTVESLLIGGWNRWRASRARQSEDAAPDANPATGDAIVLGETIPFDRQSPETVVLPQGLRPQHLVLTGSTGTGKTTALRHLLRSDFAANRAVFLLDMQGDLADGALKLLASLKSPAEMAERLIYLDLRDTRHIVPFNVLQASGPADDHMTRAMTLVDALRSVSENWGTQLHETALVSLAALSEAGQTVLQVEDLLRDRSPLRARIIAQTSSDYIRNFFRDRFEPLSPERKAAFRTPVINKMPFLAVPDLRLLLGQPKGFTFSLYDQRPSLVVIVALDGARLQEAARLTAALLVASLINYVLGRSRQSAAQRPFLSVVLDEAQNFASSRFESLLAEGRRYNVSLNLAHQHLHQMPTSLSHAIRNNCGHQMMFGCGALDAPELARGVVLDVPEGEETPDVREILLTQNVGECILTRRGQKSVCLRVAPCPEPNVSRQQLDEFRALSSAAFGMSRVAAEATTRSKTKASNEDSPIAPEVKHGKRRSFRVSDDGVA